MTDSRPPITGATKVLALLGRPIEHALSTLIHNAAFASAGLDAVFVPLSPTKGGLEPAIRSLVDSGSAGLSITIPFKTQIVTMLDALGPSAEATGAVNTVVIGSDGRLTGHNTDVDGVLWALDGLRKRTRKRAVILGAGGAARAAAGAMVQASVPELIILNRTIARAEGMAKDLEDKSIGVTVGDLSAASLNSHLPGADLLINTTSVGMYPHGDASPIPPACHHGGLDVIDAVYRPNPTQLCQDARAAGAEASPGIDWVVGQAVIALRYWLDFEPDEAAMRTALGAYFDTHV